MSKARLFASATLTFFLGSLGAGIAAPAGAALDSDTARTILVLEQSRDPEAPGFSELIKHKDPEVRAAAYRALGRIQSPASLEMLAHGLTDRKPSVREEAAFAVGQLFNSLGESVILNALDKEKEPEVRMALVEALGKSGSDNSVSLLASLLADEHPGTAHSAAIALGMRALDGTDINSAEGALRNALRGSDEELRWRAAFAVFRGSVSNALTGLFKSLTSDDPRTLIYSCRAVGAIRNPNGAEKVMPLVKHEDWRVRVEAMRALGACKIFKYTSSLSLLLEDPSEHVRLAAIQLMGDLASGGGMGRTTTLKQSSEWRVRRALILAEAQARGDGVLVDLKFATRDNDPRIREAVAAAFGLIKTEQALIVMEGMLNDESPQVQTALVSSLVEFPHIHAVKLMREFLKKSDPAVLTSAASGAGQRFDYDAVPLLVEAYDPLQSPVDTETMVAIVDALGAILTATPDDDPIGTLADSDRARAEALLEAALRDTDVNVSRSAADALSLVRGELVEPATAPDHAVPSQLDLDLATALMTSDRPPVARIVTSRGTIVIELNGRDAPGTVTNFVTLARTGYYNGISFHRVVSDFVIQGGDPRGDGWGGPGYAIRCEYNREFYERGKVGMALSGKDTGGSQFFITHSPQPHLNGRYTIFGEVVEGMDVVDQIQVGDIIEEVQLEGL